MMLMCSVQLLYNRSPLVHAGLHGTMMDLMPRSSTFFIAKHARVCSKLGLVHFVMSVPCLHGGKRRFPSHSHMLSTTRQILESPLLRAARFSKNGRNAAEGMQAAVQAAL